MRAHLFYNDPNDPVPNETDVTPNPSDADEDPGRTDTDTVPKKKAE